MEEETKQEAEKDTTEKKKIYKKWWFWTIIGIVLVFDIVILISIFQGKSSNINKNHGNNSSSNNEYDYVKDIKPDRNNEYIKEEQIDKIYSSAKLYAGKNIKLTGQVFNVSYYEDGSFELQMYRDVENADQNTIIVYYGNNVRVKEDDFIKVDGCVIMDYEYENAFGGKISAPAIIAYDVEKVSYIDAVRPTIKEIIVNQTINQKGCKVTVEKVEIAEKETRVYVTVKNSSKYNFNFWEYEAKITQGSKQYEYDSNYDADYEEVQSELLPGIESTGILTFPAINKDKNFKVVLEGNSDNYNWDIKPYTYTINVE